MAKTRLAVIGAGQFGKNHCRVIQESDRAELVAVVDVESVRAGEAAAAHGAEPLTDYRGLAGRVDAAVVAAPTSVHEEIGCWLLEAGIDALVEKPLAPDLGAADRLVAAAEKSGRVLQVGHLERFNPAVVELEKRATLSALARGGARDPGLFQTMAGAGVEVEPVEPLQLLDAAQ